MIYTEKLKDPRWQKKRLEILNRDDWACVKCGNKENTLHVHHKEYINNHEPWEYEDDNFMTLCEICHDAEHLPERLNTITMMVSKGNTNSKHFLDYYNRVLAAINVIFHEWQKYNK